MQNHPYKGRAALLTLLVAAFSAESTDAAPRPRLDHVSGDDPSAVVLAASATATNHHHHVPPMYSPGTDGVWRRRESYTLVGSTICDTCTTTPTPTVTLSDDAVKENARTLGWVHEGVSSPTRTRLTIALSVTLAVFIFLTILRFHYSWRCKRRKVDVEKRRHRKSRGGDVNPPQKGEEPVAQTKRKWMARATARWRDNARLLARKRRFSRRAGARGSQETLVSNSNSNSNSNINNNEEETETHLPHPLPRRQSRHYDAAGMPRPGSPAPSLCSLASTSTTTLEYAPGDDEEQPGHPPEQEPEQEYEPPAYPVTPPAHASTSRAPVIAISLSPPPHPHPPPADRKEMLSLGQLCADTDAHAEDFPPYTPRAEPDSAEGYFGEREGPEAAAVAHVATDDKAVLARLAGRASAPSLRATTATTATASSSSASAYTSLTDADGDGDAGDARARAPEEEELFEVQLQEIRVREAGAAPTTVPAHVWTTLPRPSSASSAAITPPSRMPTTSATLPPPPPRRASGSEKMALERAYVHADEEVYAYPSAPAYSRRYSGDADAEAGPSTPRASVVASAPPLEWDGDGEEDDCAAEEAGAGASAPPLEFWEEEDEDEERGEDGVPGPVPESGDYSDNADSHAGRRSDDQGGLGVERQRQRERERERNRHGEVHDTGWGGGGGGGSSADAGQGQDHDR